MKVLVTGADGFVGTRLVTHLADAGHTVIAAVRPGGVRPPAAMQVVSLELRDTVSVRAAVARGADAVVHLAALASGTETRQDSGATWEINAAGTARVCEALGAEREGGAADPLVLIVSTGEVYGPGPATPRTERDPVRPVSPYAASKVGAETAALETWRRTGLRVVVARPFPHTGAGQNTGYVVPAFARRLLDARRDGGRQVPVGNLEPAREFLHVTDVVDAYARLLHAGVPGEIYNIASGEAVTIRELFSQLAAIVGVVVEPVTDPALVRPSDIPHLAGDGTKLHAATEWTRSISFTELLEEIVRAQAD